MYWRHSNRLPARANANDRRPPAHLTSLKPLILWPINYLVIPIFRGSKLRQNFWRLPVFVLLMIGLGYGAWWWRNSRRLDPAYASTPFRVGFRNSQPYSHIGADGSPQGLAV